MERSGEWRGDSLPHNSTKYKYSFKQMISPPPEGILFIGWGKHSESCDSAQLWSGVRYGTVGLTFAEQRGGATINRSILTGFKLLPLADLYYAVWVP